MFGATHGAAHERGVADALSEEVTEDLLITRRLRLADKRIDGAVALAQAARPTPEQTTHVLELQLLDLGRP